VQISAPRIFLADILPERKILSWRRSKRTTHRHQGPRPLASQLGRFAIPPGRSVKGESGLILLGTR
jgi:hypothetical protein